MANIKDFATALIATAPSPATSGTSLVLATGMGARMPAVPFNAVAHPDGQLPTLDNAEQVLVTARTTDTLTITRAQGLTSAKSIATGWRLSNSIFTSDILNASSVTDELMTGTVNGTNKVFTTGSNFTNIQVYKNGVAMHLTDDFTITGANQITFVTAPATGTKLTASYILGSQTMINGSSSLIMDETPTGAVNGSNTAFTTTRPYIANTLEVFINGVKQKRGTHFTETTPTSGTFTMGDAPITGDDIMVNYQFVQSSYGNADTVDGIHANTTPTASQLLPLDSNAKINAGLLYNPYKFSVYRNAAANSGNSAFALLTFDTKDFDTGTNFSTSTGQFTAPTAGFYQFNWTVSSSANVSIWISSLFKNGSEFKRGSDARPSSQPSGSSGGALILLAANDTVDIRVFGNTTLAVGTGAAQTYLTGYLVSKS